MATKKAPRSKLLKVRADELVSHPFAQREIVPSNLKRLTETLDLDAIGVLHAVEYPINGKTRLWIIDGQHRWQALMDNGFGEWPVEVKVHLDVDNHKSASDLFLKLNKRATVMPFDSFQNELNAGYEEAVGANSVARKNGLTISRQCGDAKLACANTLKKIWRVDKGETLDATLQIVVSAWGTKASALEGRLLDGIGLVVWRFNGTIDKPAMVKKLAKHPGGASGLLGDAKGLMAYSKSSMSKCVAECVIAAYNSGRRVGRLDPL